MQSPYSRYSFRAYKSQEAAPSTQHVKHSGQLRKSGDATVEDWCDPMAGLYRVEASTRFGLGILRSNAVAKMFNIKTSL